MAKRRRDDGVEVKVVAVCSLTAASRARAKKKLGMVDVAEYATLAEAVDHSSANVFLLSLPREAAASAIETCLLRSKVVISDKPSAWSREEAEQCWRALLIGHSQWRVMENWAFKPGVLKVCELLDSGAIGDDVAALTYEMTCRRRRSPGGGWREECAPHEQLLDVAVHPVRAVRCWFGEVVLCEAGWLRHDTGAHGKLCVEWGDEEMCVCEIRAGRHVLRYDVDARSIVVDGVEQERLGGDSWIEGGARAALTEAIFDRGELTCAEEALRDLAVALALCKREPLVHMRPLLAPSSKGSWLSRPRSADDAVADVTNCRKLARPVLPVGAATSWGRALTLPGREEGLVFCCISELRNRVRRIVKDVVVVEAGIRLRRLTASLASRHFCLPSLPVYQDATAGGACATGSHGSSAHHGTLSDSICALHIVFYDGSRTWLARDDASLDSARAPQALRLVDPLMFDAARCSIGRIGVVLDIAFRVAPAYRVSRRCLMLQGGFNQAHLVDTLLQAEHAWVHWLLTENQSEVHAIFLDKDGDHWYDGRNWFPYSAYIAARLPAPKGRLDSYSIQYALPFDQLDSAAADLARALQPHLTGGTTAAIEIKLLRAPPAELGGPALCAPNAAARRPGDIVACFNVYSTAPPPAWLAVFESILRERSAVPHFGKDACLNMLDVQKRLPCVAAFLAFARARPGACPRLVDAILSTTDDAVH